MSRTTRRIAKLEDYASVFSALGDKTRLSLVGKLAKGEPLSISQLTDGSKLTRQAITKHLRALENVGLVKSSYSGRENVFELKTRPFKSISEYLDFITAP